MTFPYPDSPAGAEGDPPVVLGDRYELLELLGRGGMAEVYRARDRDLERSVAVKLLPAGNRDDDIDSLRLQQEARAAAGLNHPHAVAVHDVGRSAHGVYVVMELLPGATWRDQLRRRDRQSEVELARIGAAVASALAAAHARGIVHRDVNPSNVMLLDDGTPKLVDFGIARTGDRGGLTDTGAVVGTAAYMSPEQVRGDVVDGRSDVYSLGCALYEAATGRLPFVGHGSADVASLRLRELPVPPRQVAPALSVGLEDLILRALAVSAPTRPDAEDVAAALDAIVADRRDPLPIPAPRQTTPSERVDPLAVPDPATTRRGAPDSSATGPGPPDANTPVPGAGLRRAGVALVACGLIAVVVLLALALL